MSVSGVTNSAISLSGNTNPIEDYKIIDDYQEPSTEIQEGIELSNYCIQFPQRGENRTEEKWTISQLRDLFSSIAQFPKGAQPGYCREKKIVYQDNSNKLVRHYNQAFNPNPIASAFSSYQRLVYQILSKKSATEENTSINQISSLGEINSLKIYFKTAIRGIHSGLANIKEYYNDHNRDFETQLLEISEAAKELSKVKLPQMFSKLFGEFDIVMEDVLRNIPQYYCGDERIIVYKNNTFMFEKRTYQNILNFIRYFFQTDEKLLSLLPEKVDENNFDSIPDCIKNYCGDKYFTLRIASKIVFFINYFTLKFNSLEQSKEWSSMSDDEKVCYHYYKNYIDPYKHMFEYFLHNQKNHYDSIEDVVLSSKWDYLIKKITKPDNHEVQIASNAEKYISTKIIIKRVEIARIFKEVQDKIDQFDLSDRSSEFYIPFEKILTSIISLKKWRKGGEAAIVQKNTTVSVVKKDPQIVMDFIKQACKSPVDKRKLDEGFRTDPNVVIMAERYQGYRDYLQKVFLEVAAFFRIFEEAASKLPEQDEIKELNQEEQVCSYLNGKYGKYKKYLTRFIQSQISEMSQNRNISSIELWNKILSNLETSSAINKEGVKKYFSKFIDWEATLRNARVAKAGRAKLGKNDIHQSDSESDQSDLEQSITQAVPVRRSPIMAQHGNRQISSKLGINNLKTDIKSLNMDLKTELLFKGGELQRSLSEKSINWEDVHKTVREKTKRRSLNLGSGGGIFEKVKSLTIVEVPRCGQFVNLNKDDDDDGWDMEYPETQQSNLQKETEEKQKENTSLFKRLFKVITPKKKKKNAEKKKAEAGKS